MKNGSLMLFRGRIYLIVKRRWFYTSLGKMLFAVVFLLGVAMGAALAQAPKKLNFQGIARDANGKIFVGDVNLRFTIHKDGLNGQVVHYEECGISTNTTGTFSTYIGKCTPLTSIDWSSGSYYLQVAIAIDPNQSDFHDIGAMQMLSVPYAFHATDAMKLVDFNPIVQLGDVDKGSTFPSVGNGARLVWHPRKAAFRVGSVSTGLWENNYIGENSFGAGKDTWAGGNTSIAIGLGAVSKMDNSVALGVYNDATNDVDRLFQIGNGASSADRDNALTILRNGNVGIGSNSKNPQFKLDVDGRARIKFHNAEPAGIYFNNSANALGGFVGLKNDSEIGFANGGTWLLRANTNGTVYMDNYSLTSDKRLKTDFKNLSGSLAKLSQLQGYSYRWLDTIRTQTLQTGLIAQEVEKLFPELVSTDDKGYKSMNYNGLIPHLIEAVKELKGQTAEIAELRKELNELKMLAGQKGSNGATPGSVKSK